MEWIQRPLFNHLGKSTEILAHALYIDYCAPEEFEFDVFDSKNDPFVVDRKLSTFNADKKAVQFMTLVNHWRDHYRTNHILVPMGCDFSFTNAKMNFESMDALIETINERYHFNTTVMYSTPGEYIKAIGALNVVFPTRYADMFPYADLPEDYWTGYFSSRPNYKKYVRDGSANLHASNKLYGIKVLDQELSNGAIASIIGSKYTMLDAMGVSQHHDAITGTEKQHVCDDYTTTLFDAMEKNNLIYEEIINDHTFKFADIKADKWYQCFKQNSTWLDCPLANYNAGNITFLVNVHNPTLDYVHYQKIKVPHDKYRVFSWDDSQKKWENVRSQVFCLPVMLENGITINDCELHVENMIYPNHFSVLQV